MVSDELVNGVAGGSAGGDTEAADEPTGADVDPCAWLGTDPAGECSAADAAGTGRAGGGVVGAGGTSTLVGRAIGSPSPALRVGAGLERTVRPGPANGDRCAADAFGVAVGEGATDAGVASGSASGSGAVGRKFEDGVGVSSSIRPDGAAPSLMAERWSAGTTVIAARGLGVDRAGSADGGVAVRGATRLGTVGAGSGEPLEGADAVDGSDADTASGSTALLAPDRRGR